MIPWETVIGLELHVQLATKSKLFSGAANRFGAGPNENVCAFDLALPGTLPVVNEQALRLAIKLGLALEAHIAEVSVFARKNYFYPDLPKGYQISQYDQPIVSGGRLRLPGENGRYINIERAHLEEDAGKSVHDQWPHRSAVDLNRAGVPLIEIVSKPEMHSPDEAVLYMRRMHQLVRHLGVSTADMEKGEFRCDANVSIKRQDESQLGTRVEIKNLNSFRFVAMALEYEIKRHRHVLNDGGRLRQETRLYDSSKNETRPMRGKEEAADYRYFPDPDLPPVLIPAKWVEEIKRDMPELPDDKARRFETELGLTAEQASTLAGHPETGAYFDQCLRQVGTEHARITANWIIGELAAALNRTGITIDQCPVTAPRLARLIQLLTEDAITGTQAKKLLRRLWTEAGTADELLARHPELGARADKEKLVAWADEVIAAYPAQVQQYLGGKSKVIGFLTGQMMKKSAGQAEPADCNRLLTEKLAALSRD